MEAQTALLRAMLSGSEPVTPENLLRAANRDVLASRAVRAQDNDVATTLEALESEREELASLIARRHDGIKRLRELLPASSYGHKSASRLPLKPNDDGVPSLVDISPLRGLVSGLAENHLAQLGLGDPKQIELILWKLVEVSARNEQLVVPEDLKIVQFLAEEQLLRSEPAGPGQLRIKLF